MPRMNQASDHCVFRNKEKYMAVGHVTHDRRCCFLAYVVQGILEDTVSCLQTLSGSLPSNNIGRMQEVYDENILNIGTAW